jgi:hypothetical protein
VRLAIPQIDEIAVADIIGDREGIAPARPQEREAVVLEPLPADVWEFSQRCCFTYDQRAAEFGRQTVAPFPDWDCLRFILESITVEPRVWAEKSVQVMFSWAVAVWALHDVLQHEGHEGAWFCLDRALAAKHIEERIWRLYESIPDSFSKPVCKIIGGVFYVFRNGLDRPPTGSITPMAQETSVEDKASKKAVSWTWTWALVDEGARTRKVEEVIDGLATRCGKIIFPSSVDGPTYHHAIGYAPTLSAEDRYKADIAPELLPGDEGQPMRGVKCWRRFGWFCLEIRYFADPNKDPQRPEGQRWWLHPATVGARAKTAKWARDMECNAAVSAGTPVYEHTDRIASGRQSYLPHLPMIRGHDYSFISSAAVVLQVVWDDKRQAGGTRSEESGREAPTPLGRGRYVCRVIKEVWSENSFIKPHKERVVETCATLFGDGLQWTDYGDYSANQRTSTGVLIEEMRPEINLVTVPTGPGGVRLRTETVQQLISDGQLEVDKEECPMLWQALTSRYVRDANGEPVDEHPWADLADALGYAVINLFLLDRTSEGVMVARLKDRFTGSQGPNQPSAYRRPGTLSVPTERGPLPENQPQAGLYRRNRFRGMS